MQRHSSGLFLGLSSGPQAGEGDAMFASLPEHPDIDQLRRRAKELRDDARRGEPAAMQRFARQRRSAAPGSVSLAAAQLVIARELGFPSWPQLKAAIDADADVRAGVNDFVAASVDGRMRKACDILRADPGIAGRSLRAATVLGDVAAVRQRLAAEPAAAVAIDDDRGWPPLLYVCYSRWHQIDPDRRVGLAEVARVLLDVGASPNTNDGGRRVYRSALKGSVEVNNPAITQMLLDAGADPNPGQPIGEAIGHRDHECLRLLLAHGARVAGTWAVGAAVYNDDASAISLLLDAIARGGGSAAQAATDALAEAAADASLEVVVALLHAGADPRAANEDGVSALRLAVRAGQDDIASQLRAHGAGDDATDVDRFIGACLRADHGTAQQLLADHPDLRDRFTDDDRAVIFDAASSQPAETVALMLRLGFSPDAGRFGERPLHAAAYHGNAPAVRLLLDAGAEVDARDARFDATPLAFATVGSGERAGQPGDWIETIRLLVAAGASRRDVWVSEKPPSEEVVDLLRHYGITPDEPEVRPADPIDRNDSIGTGVMADIARHLEAAYRDRDLDILASLLHPDVGWTGVCTNRDHVLDWYRGLLADGTTADVEGVEVDGDAVLLHLSVALTAEGARPAPAQRLYQVFIVNDAQVVQIHGYPDRASALRAVRGPGLDDRGERAAG
jgi:ankyrin repeat protein